MIRTSPLVVTMVATLATGLPARSTAQGPLTISPLSSDEVAVVAAKGVAASGELARHYAEQRGLPDGRVIEVEFPEGVGETLPSDAWRDSVRPAIRAWLDKNDPERKVRCLVTTWGVPLKISPAEVGPELAAYKKFLTAERASRVEKLSRVAAMMDQIGGGAPLSSVLDALPGEKTSEDSIEDLRVRLDAAVRGAQTRLAGVPAEELQPQQARLQQLAGAVGGASVLMQSVQSQIQQRASAGQETPAAVVQQYAALAGRVSAFAEARKLIETQPAGPQRDAMILRLIEQANGLLGSVVWIDQQLAAAEKNETGASLDSELSLVLWPGDYQLLRWQPNYLNAAYRDGHLGEAFPTMMVARLDGPNPETARRLVDDAIAVERDGGLRGKVYLDARGLDDDQESEALLEGSYKQYDESLKTTAEGLGEMTNGAGEPRFDVVLEESKDLFAEGACPDAALYCGWYQLGEYADAFDWRRGAIAYHLASGEAATLRSEGKRAWCQGLLEDGVCATIGPVYEPYLVAFPKPNEFFGLLINGGATLGDAYYATQPFNSWAMTLIGDPLYRPFPTPQTLKAE